jgi:hypothetical protein
LIGFAAAAGLAATLRDFLLPITYEIQSVGLRRDSIWRSSVIPWQAVRSYEIRPTGVLLYRIINPSKLDVLGSLFIPYASAPDEVIIALRQHLSHALELEP